MEPNPSPSEPRTSTRSHVPNPTGVNNRSRYISETAPATIWPEIARRLILGQTQKQIALALGRTPATICHTLKLPGFIQLLSEAQTRREDSMYSVQEHFAPRIKDACEYLDGLFKDPLQPPTVKLSVVDRIFKLTGADKPPARKSDPGPGDIRTMTFERRMSLTERVYPNASSIVDGLSDDGSYRPPSESYEVGDSFDLVAELNPSDGEAPPDRLHEPEPEPGDQDPSPVDDSYHYPYDPEVSSMDELDDRTVQVLSFDSLSPSDPGWAPWPESEPVPPGEDPTDWT